MEVSIDSIKIFKPIIPDEIRLTSFSIVNYYPYFLRDDIKQKGMNFNGKIVSGFSDEVRDLENRLIYKIYRNKYPYFGNVLVLDIPIASYALYRNPIKNVELIDLYKWIKEIEKKYCIIDYPGFSKTKWYVSRLDIKFDIFVDSIQDCLWEFRSYYNIPRWHKDLYPKFDNTKNITDGVYFYTECKSNKNGFSRILKFYNKSSQLNKAFPRFIYPENLLRVEYSMQRSKEVRKIGVEVIEDISNINAAEILFITYNMLKKIGDDKTCPSEFLSMIKDIALKGENVSLEEILTHIIIMKYGSDIIENCIYNLDRKSFIKYFTELGIKHNRSWKWWDKLQKIQYKFLTNEKPIKTFYYEQIYNELKRCSINNKCQSDFQS
jgi:hypothetical protein